MAREKKGAEEEAAPPPPLEKGARVRARILETIKRGVANNQHRAAEMGAGERRLLEHMRLYVMETKLAEAELGETEKAIWEDMKRDYTRGGAKPDDDS